MATGFETMGMLLSEGCLEMLHLMDKKKVCRFGDFTALKNKRTKRLYAKTTVSLRLKELDSAGYVENVVLSSKERKVLGYRLTGKGEKALRVSERYEEELEKL